MAAKSDGLLGLVAQNTWIFNFAGVVLVFVGWYVAYNNAAKLATRSESKSLVDALSKLLNEVTDLAIDYWLDRCKSPKSIVKIVNGIKIKTQIKHDDASSQMFIMSVFTKINQSIKYIELLDARGIHIENSFIADFLTKVTLDCETAHNMTQQERASRVQEILSLSSEAMNQVYSQFQNNHLPSKPLHLFKFLKEKWSVVEKWYKSLG
ncbi:hypothetical protein [Kluyvera georgiana]|uniref:hypothetical protein n=1 Tax=Kluyvera georgiana TaxID=73098 RepID=UPI0008070497|nr:hypothetical protein [Kluyvera georgiana]